MKIGIICPYNMFKGGGVQEVVTALQAGLESRGYDAKIITPLPREYIGPSPQGMILIGGSTDVKSPFLHTTAQIAASVDTDALEKMLEHEQFDILHYHEPWVPILSWQILTRSNAVNIATFHAKLPETVMTRTIERVITPYTKTIIKYIDTYSAVSSAAADYVQSLTDVPITIVPNGVDLSKYRNVIAKASIASRKRHTILYVGRLEKRKGVHYLLQAYELLRMTCPNIRLQIVGDGPERERLENEVRDRNLPDVEFLGFVSDAKKLQLLKNADLFCSPAPYGESFGIVLLEAMAVGLVTVAGDNPGYASVMKERGMLSLINPKDAVDFARRMELLLTDEPLRAQWQEWALEYVKRFDYEKIVDQYIDLYDKAVHDKQHKPRQ
jgi:phosphatidylinositol alpha-mannosyltransferase